MNKKIIITIAFVIVLVAGISYFKFWTKEEPKITFHEGIFVTSPGVNEDLVSPFKIVGYINGNGWTAFEGQAGVARLKYITKDATEVIGMALLTASTDWMNLLVFFETSMSFNKPLGDGEVILEITNENPSGLSEYDKTFSFPVKIKNIETSTVKVYFSMNQSVNNDCNIVFSVNRVIAKTDAVAMAAISELLKGPTEKEKLEGYFSNINSGVELKDLNIENEIVRVDFDEKLERAIGGSCMVSAIRAQITETLKQFLSVKEVIISINGRTEDILQP